MASKKKAAPPTVASEWNMRCPKCQSDAQIDIAATVWVRLVVDGTDMTEAENGDHTWDDSSPTICRACGYASQAYRFEL